MACVTASTVVTGTTAVSGRASTSRCQPRVHILARPSFRPSGARLQQLNRNNLAKATYSGCWGPVGTCGPTTDYRRWTTGPSTQRSVDRWAGQASNNMWFPVDVEETAQQYTFVADVPGLGKNDIKVSLLLSGLAISVLFVASLLGTVQLRSFNAWMTDQDCHLHRSKSPRTWS